MSNPIVPLRQRLPLLALLLLNLPLALHARAQQEGWNLSTDPTGRLTIENDESGSPLKLQQLYNHGGRGGALSLFEEDGVAHVRIEPDVAGTDGFMLIGDGFMVDGNTGNEETWVAITGSNSIAFDTGVAGNGSVVLPNDAVAAVEVLNEAGAANAQTSNVTVTATHSVVLNRTITAPSDGFVIAFGAVESGMSHVNGTPSNVSYGVSTDCDATPTTPVNQDFQHIVPAGAPSGGWNTSISPIGLFTVAAGNHTFCLVGRRLSGSSSTAFDVQLTLLFVPTSYGSIVPNASAMSSPSGDPNEQGGAPRAGFTPADVASERAASDADNQARIERELAEMRAQVEALKRQLEATLREQGAARGAGSSGGN